MQRHAPIGVLAVLAALAAACGDKVTIVECRLGFEPRGSECIPIGSGPDADDGTPDTSTPDTEPKPDAPDFPIVDTVDAPDESDPPDVPDVGPDDGAVEPDDGAVGPDDGGGPVGGAVGAVCNKSGDCEGETCLDWPGGYCTKLDCDEAGCPEGSTCVPAPGGNHMCVKTCQTDDDCREGGEQACKRVEGLDGEGLVDACHGVADQPSGPGETCDTAVDCEGGASCLGAMPGGYCAALGCDAGSCPQGTDCVDFGDHPTCLRLCQDDEDCGGEEGAERSCGVLKAVDGDKVGACISGTQGQPIGAQCTNDFECQSGTCQILGKGFCTQSNEPCFPDTEDLDCLEGGFCQVTSESVVGTCTQPCSVAQGCQGAAYCVGLPGEPEGWCRPACDGLGESDDCRADAGMTCTFGFPLGGTTGQGTYVCMIVDSGDVGAACGPSQGCPGGQCEMTVGETEGTCTRGCGTDFYCPFPGLCVDDGGTSGTCRKACQSVADCPDGTSCEKTGLGSVCQ
ncbi:MAG: hypothetical protein ACQEXJ_22660 [Myxococcota bacterium]